MSTVPSDIISFDFCHRFIQSSLINVNYFLPNKWQPNLYQPLTATHFQLNLGQAHDSFLVAAILNH
jgi:hypothetical protein